MSQILRHTILILFVLSIAQAQQKSEIREADRFAASVRELKGVCLVRDNKAAKPRELKSEEKLQAGQEIKCGVGAYLKIQFRSSGADKIITAATNPDWFIILNVPAGPLSK